MADLYWLTAMMTASYLLGRHHEAGNDDIKFMLWSVLAGVIWPAWWTIAACNGIREGK